MTQFRVLSNVSGALWQRLTSDYWAAFAALVTINTMLLGASSAAAGLTIESFTAGTREVAIINILALTILFWPTVGLMVKGLHARRHWCCWATAAHAVAVFILMESYFGKPFGLTDGSAVANIVPTVIFMALSAWLIVEWRLGGRRAASAA